MKLPPVSTEKMYTSRPYRYYLEIPPQIEFEAPTDTDTSEFRAIVAAYNTDKAATYQTMHAKYQAMRLSWATDNTKDILPYLWIIETDLTAEHVGETVPQDAITLFTEALLLKLHTLDIDYPMLLAALYVTPRKDYTYREFSAAYYLYCLHTGLLGGFKFKYPRDIELFEKLRRETYQTQITTTHIETPKLTPYELLSAHHITVCDMSPLPEILYTYTVGDVDLPYFVYSRWYGVELYLLTPIMPKTANKLLTMYKLAPNNLLVHHTNKETAILRLDQTINQLNLPLNITRIGGYKLYPMPEIIDINTLVGLPGTGNKSDMFLKYPLVKRILT